MQAARVTLPIIGLSLGGCGALTIEHALARRVGILRVYVNPATECAYIEYDSERTSVESIAAAIRQTGYRTGQRSELSLS